MARAVAEDGALIDQTSHWDTSFNGGRKFPPDFVSPVTFNIDLDIEGRRMPTLFVVPALVARKAFLEVLRAAGVDNVDSYPALIRNGETGEVISDYVVLNVIGTANCVDLAASDSSELGEDLRIIDVPVLRAKDLPDAHMFRLAEDPLQIIVSEQVADGLRSAGFDDVYLQPVRLV